MDSAHPLSSFAHPARATNIHFGEREQDLSKARRMGSTSRNGRKTEPLLLPISAYGTVGRRRHLQHGWSVSCDSFPRVKTFAYTWWCGRQERGYTGAASSRQAMEWC